MHCDSIICIVRYGLDGRILGQIDVLFGGRARIMCLVVVGMHEQGTGVLSCH